MTNDERLLSGPASQTGSAQKPRTSQGLFDSNIRSEPVAQSHDTDSWYSGSHARRNGTKEISNKIGTPNRQRYSALGAVTSRSPGGQRNASKRQSGGFLLGSSFGRNKRHSAQTTKDSPAGHGQRDRVSHEATPSPHSSRSSKSQGKAPAYASIQDKRQGDVTIPAVDGMEDTRSEQSRDSHYGSGASRSSGPSEASSTIDPNQLISMALALSDGRRRAASGISQAPKPINSRRVVSTGTRKTSVAPGSPLSNDILKQRMSSRPSPYLTPSPERFRSPELASEIKTQQSAPPIEQPIDVDFKFSVSTLQRAERARQYFELSNQYRRFLTCLPPLKPDSTAPGNVSVQTQSVAGSPLPIITRIGTKLDAKHDLGRQYNPLQYLRNERLRNRQGKRLIPPAEDFDDLERVSNFVNQTASRADQSRALTMPDMVALPRWHFDDQTRSSPPTHGRNGTASSKILWLNSGWSFTPMSLFADTLWTESPDNKWSVENRRGQRIFPELKSPQASVEDQDPVALHNKRVRPASGEEHGQVTDSAEHRGRHKRKFLSIHKLNDDEGRRRPWRRNHSASSSRASSRSSMSAFGTFGGAAADGVNIGPLVRHMQKQMQQAEFNSPDGIVSPGQWDDLPPETDKFPDAPLEMDMNRNGSLAQKRGLKPTPLEIHKSRSFTEGVKQNAEGVINSKRANNLLTPQTGDITVRSASEAFGSMPMSAATYQSSNLSPRNIDGETMKAPPAETSYLDFANTNGSAPKPVQTDEPVSAQDGRRSFDSTRSFKPKRHGTTKSVSSTRKQLTDSDNEKASRGHGKSMSRLLKGSRIAELVRGDTTRRSEKEKRDGTRSPRSAQPLSDGSDQSDSEDDRKLKRRDTDMSMSSVSSDKPRYHVPLPSFKFPNGLDSGRNSVISNDPITQQQDVRREQSKSSRHTKMAPPRIEVPGEDPKTKAKGIKDEDNQGLRGLLSPIKRLRSGTGPSRPPSIRPPLSTQNSTTDFKVKQPESALNHELEPIGRRQRQWSIANQLDRPIVNKTQTTTIRDVERVRALFLSSGIKACELCRRGNSVPDQQSDFLAAVFEKTGQRYDHVRQREQCRTAGRLWSEAIVRLHNSSEHELQQFRDNKVPQLRDKIDHLRHIVGEQLTVKVQSTADDADAFATDLTTHQTLAVRNVHDTIDSLMRRRRRNWRMMRRIGFTMLEWFLLGVMWLAWFVFTLIKMVHSIFWGLFKVVRWLSFL